MPRYWHSLMQLLSFLSHCFVPHPVTSEVCCCPGLSVFANHYALQDRFILEVKPVIEDATRLGSGQRRYTGDKLSLNFQNVEVRAVLQVLADFTGLNIITSDTVAGNLTLRLKDVPWDQAMDIILQA